MALQWDLAAVPLEVKTNSVLGSDDQVRLALYSAEGEYAGVVYLYFTSPPQYSLHWCGPDTIFPTTIPSATDKVWRFTLTRTAGIRLVIHCNDVEVLNFLFSDTTCISKSSWSTIWSRDVATILFRSDGTAPDYYGPSK